MSPTLIHSLTDQAVPPWERGVRYQGELNQAAMKRVLFDVADALDKYQIPFVLALGTLIGALREKQFLSWDNDADIFTTWEHYPKMDKAIEELRAKGYLVPTGCPLHDTNIIYHNAAPGQECGEKVEMWWFGKCGERLYYYPDFWIWPKWLEETTELEFLGRKFRIPKDYDGFLEFLYKDNWRVPSAARWTGRRGE